MTDAWYPQVNGVVRTLDTITRHLRARGHTVTLLTPEGRRTVPLPTYPEIRLALASPRTVARLIGTTRPDCIHIATEGPLGWLARRHCLNAGLAFTTSFHSRFPEMIASRLPLPGVERLAQAILKRFHAPAQATLVPTPSVARRLEAEGFGHVEGWGRGVDTAQFRPLESDAFAGLARPVMLNAGRVAIEKNLEAFLSLDLPGTRVIVGDGPQLAELRRRYPDVVFTGYLNGDDLARTLSAADVFVFPSHTDTFGLVMLEALACGVPVAAFPVEGPVDVITSPRVGCLDTDLARAIRTALGCSRKDCVAFARRHSWPRIAQVFLDALTPVRPASHRRTGKSGLKDLVAEEGLEPPTRGL
ncbi:MAG: glycosyltransferase family 1 protein [Anderseniella sp.]|nr:glycosyltransferase family 1 protein [Anderseniella sp.]